jgi:fatty acid amide hydrolase 2
VSPPITERSAVALAGAIRRGELTSSEVVQAHIAVHQRLAGTVNAIAQDRYEMAMREAWSADEVVRGAADDAALLPLLGVPFTVKESIALAGMPQTAGLVARREHRATVSAPPVQRLLDAGAIAIGVTNTSELTLWIESENRLYGRTSNPYDLTRTVGGSSGGEGAAVGSGGSPFGVASDIGGSIRVPAMFCGVFGHKPSAGLVPTTGNYPAASAENAPLLGIGPIARRAEDLMPILRIIAGPDGQDHSVTESVLGDPASVSLSGLKVLITEWTSRRPMSRELHGARERAAEALAARGAVIERVKLPEWRSAWLPFLARLQAGADGSTFELLEEAGAERPTLRTLLARGGPHTLPTRLVLLPELLPRAAGSESSRMLARAAELGRKLREMVGDGVMLHPAHPRVAPRHRTTTGRPWLLTGAAVFNLAGLPVTEVPLGRSRKGLPLGVQVAAGPNRDHVSIAVALELERAFGGWQPPPGA